MIVRRQFPYTPDSVARARHVAAVELGDLPDELVESVSLMVSELGTNAIKHARSGFTLEIERREDKVRVSVSDSGGGHPAIGSPGSKQASGRGLRIVEILSDDWGVVPASQGAGKTVWFTIAQPVPITHRSAARH